MYINKNSNACLYASSASKYPGYIKIFFPLSVSLFPGRNINRKSIVNLLLQSLPLLRGITLRRPSMDSRDLRLQNRVHQTVTSEHGLLLELRGDNHRLECLATAAY